MKFSECVEELIKYTFFLEFQPLIEWWWWSFWSCSASLVFGYLEFPKFKAFVAPTFSSYTFWGLTLPVPLNFLVWCLSIWFLPLLKVISITFFRFSISLGNPLLGLVLFTWGNCPNYISNFFGKVADFLILATICFWLAKIIFYVSSILLAYMFYSYWNS